MKRIIKIALAAALAIALAVSAYAATSAAPRYYTSAVRWAWEQGITNGTSATTFSPDRHVTREELVTMLWRMAGSPEPHGASPFEDIEPEPDSMPTPTPTPAPTNYGTAGRLYIGNLFSVALYSSDGRTAQEIVDEADSAWIHRGWGNTIIGDHFDDGFYRIRFLQPGDICYILHEDGSREEFVCVRVDQNGANTGGDVLDSTGASAFDDPNSDMFMYTCNPANDWRSVTVVYWARTEGTGADVEAMRNNEQITIPITESEETEND